MKYLVIIFIILVSQHGLSDECEILGEYANCLITEGDDFGVMELMEKEISSDPHNGDVYIRYAEALHLLGETEQGIKVLNSGILKIKKFNPTKENHSVTQTFYAEIPLYKKLTSLYFENNDIESALKVLNEGVLRNSGSGELLDLYLKVLSLNGEISKSDEVRKTQCGLYFVSGDVCKRK